MAWPVPEFFYLLARRFWPGPLTIIVRADPKLPLKVTANTGNVALRVPAAEVPLAIIRSAGLPITATSANLHGEIECTSAMQVRDQLGDCLSIIVDGGQVPGILPTTIVDVTGDGGWRILRHGAIPEDQIAELLGQE
jgi:L-threonylcarbamoyladenylate synthase